MFAISFMTAANASALSLDSFTPPNNETGVELDANIVLNFAEIVYVGTGSIDIYDSGDTLFESISSGITPGSGTQITINPSSDFTEPNKIAFLKYSLSSSTWSSSVFSNKSSGRNSFKNN